MAFTLMRYIICSLLWHPLHNPCTFYTLGLICFHQDSGFTSQEEALTDIWGSIIPSALGLFKQNGIWVVASCGYSRVFPGFWLLLLFAAFCRLFWVTMTTACTFLYWLLSFSLLLYFCVLTSLTAVCKPTSSLRRYKLYSTSQVKSSKHQIMS